MIFASLQIQAQTVDHNRHSHVVQHVSKFQ